VSAPRSEFDQDTALESRPGGFRERSPPAGTSPGGPTAGTSWPSPPGPWGRRSPRAGSGSPTGVRPTPPHSCCSLSRQLAIARGPIPGVGAGI